MDFVNYLLYYRFSLLERIMDANSNVVPESSTTPAQELCNKPDTPPEVNAFSSDITTTAPPKPFVIERSISYLNNNEPSSSRASQGNTNSRRVPVTTQPMYKTYLNLPSPMSLNMPPPNQPQTLFVQALSMLNESSATLNTLSQMRTKLAVNQGKPNETNVSDSLTPCPSNPSINAPPSYSFVLRQMTHQRRPRLMGTFIPSPSFVVHTPPPNYTTAFDIYVDNPIPPQRTTRVFNFGYTSMPAVCPECGYAGMTMVTSKVTLCTHLCAMTLCLFCCWICAPLPYLMMSCKDVYHYCRNCQTMLGMYCPTDPECTYPS